MPTTIVRVYETEEQAADTARALEQAGFAADSVLLVTPATADAAARTREMDMRDLGDFITAQLANEHSVVAVRPPFGRALVATKILDQAGPLAITAPEPAAETSRKSTAAPLSDLFGWGLLSNSATPISDMFGMRVLSKTAAPLSDKFGWSTRSAKTHYLTGELSRNPAPLSSRLGMALLSTKAAPLSDKFGWPTRSEKTHYMTTDLSNDPTPLSSRLGLSVLSEKQ